MALQHLRSSTAHKRPIPTVMSAGQIAINTNEASPGLFFKDSNGDLVKVGPVHIGTTAPNSSPASVAATALVTGTVYQILTVGTSDFTLVGASANTVGTIFTATGTTTGTGTVSGQQGVEKGEQWLDTTGGTYVLKIYDGTDWRSESGTFVDVSGDTMTGDLVMNNANIVFEGATADDFETTLTVTDPTADRSIVLPDVSGDIVTTGDTGTVTSTMIADGTIVNADVNASAAIAGTKIDPDFGSQTIETTGVFSAADGAAATPSITFTGDTNTGIYRPGADQLAISTNGTGRLFVDASGNVGIGTASPSHKLDLLVGGGSAGANVYNNATGAAYYQLATTSRSYKLEAVGSDLRVYDNTGSSEAIRIDSSGRVGVGTSSALRTLHIAGAGDTGLMLQTTNAVDDKEIWEIQVAGDASNHANLIFRSRTNAGTGGTEALRITNDGNVGIGTSSPNAQLETIGSFRVSRDGSPGTYMEVFGGSSSADPYLNVPSGFGLPFRVGGSEVARFDSSGRLLVGTSTGGSVARLQVQGSTLFNDAFVDICYNGSAASGIAANTVLGSLRFTDQASSTNQFATIKCETDAAASSGDYPGRLVFSTTADGAAAPTERMRIDKYGYIYAGRVNTDRTATGLSFETSFGVLGVTSSTNRVLDINRQGNDGDLILFFQGNSQEGSISVSGTTVSYNGAHLSRWSQLPNNAERIEILRGTVLSNIDEMCEWGDEDNEQLNRMKISDVEGDRNVSGVFQAWDDDDDTYTNDFYCAMTGDFVIRIAQGTTVARGDLLMSAGDGTAKPQNDDIVRSKTIAKVTSTVVSETYSDGSYCVPCVLMAC